MAAIDIRSRLAALAKWPTHGSPVVSVYLNTRWADEHQRERVRIFLKNELRRARDAGRAGAEDLDWIESQGRALIEQSAWPDAHGVALFASRAAGLAEVLPVRVPFDDAFVVNDVPYLPPLAMVVDETPGALVVFVDGTSARLIPLTSAGAGEELALEAPVEGRHRNGGWAALAQGRYQRHIEEHREQHFAAVAAAITEWSDRQGAERIVVAGEPRMIAMLREHLSDRVLRKVVGTVSAARYESARVIVRRAEELLAHVDQSREGEAVDSVLTEAAKGGQAVDGLDGTLEAVNRGSVRHLYVLREFRDFGRVCQTCAALQRGLAGGCAYCGHETKPVPLDEAIIDRVIAAGGAVTRIERHAQLAQRGGIVALLRYAA
ncbi:MAG: host attachment protein [Candidatus Rokubacteria bacterium]|nr:host attachment protein [Candidatus Rokubacteria bacterium]